MYAGQVVESGPTRTVIERPLHPYTQGLLGSIPRLSRLEEKIRPIEGTVPELIDLPPQCLFRDRCSQAVAACSAVIPLRRLPAGRRRRCLAGSAAQRVGEEGVRKGRP